MPIHGEGFATSIKEFGQMIRHHGEEFCYVLEGTLEFHTELYTPVILDAPAPARNSSSIG